MKEQKAECPGPGKPGMKGGGGESWEGVRGVAGRCGLGPRAAVDAAGWAARWAAVDW